MVFWSRTSDCYISNIKVASFFFVSILYFETVGIYSWNMWLPSKLGLTVIYLGGICLKKKLFFPNNFSCGSGLQTFMSIFLKFCKFLS